MCRGEGVFKRWREFLRCVGGGVNMKRRDAKKRGCADPCVNGRKVSPVLSSSYTVWDEGLL